MATERTSITVKSERAVVAAVRLPDSTYDQKDPFGEIRSLAEQAGALIVGEIEQRRQRPEAGTYIGTGKLVEIKGLCDAVGATMVIFDHDLSPKQISKIEEVVERKVIDRSELILDIFAGRAATHEAKLQVELAQLEYTYPRLRAMWTHLERIVGHGGIGGIGTRGPGEQQLEIDRRIVQRKKLELRRDLDAIHARKRRTVRDRKRSHFTVCIVGYTNAGKSTLFNSLTGLTGATGGAYADDRVFATLMTRTREWNVGDTSGSAPDDGNAEPGRTFNVMLSDTVGFVRDLPHHLVASFRATLEEAVHADLLLVVLDISDPAAELHYQTVCATLDDLISDEARRWSDDDGGEGRYLPPRRLLLLNKIDAVRDNRDLIVWRRMEPEAIEISAAQSPPDGQGHEALRARVFELATGGELEHWLEAPMSAGKLVNAIETRATVLERDYVGEQVRFRVRVGRRQLDQLRSIGGRALVVSGDHGVPPAWRSA